MKPHQVLSRFSGHPDFEEIRRHFLEALNSGLSASEILELLNSRFEMAEMREKGVPITIVNPENSLIDGATLNQIHTASKLPVAVRGALLPDAHLGYALPIGGVIALDNAVSPSFVGYDISCMMRLSLLEITPEELEKQKEYFLSVLIKVTSFGLGANFASGEREHKVMDNPLWNEIPTLKNLKVKAQEQLGSSGGGNHFADLVVINEGGKKLVGLLTHSGSRGTGHQVATHYSKLAEQQTRAHTRGIPKDYSWLDLDSEEGQEYWEAMNLMGLYAEANHLLIHKHFSKESSASIYGNYSNKHNFAWHEVIELVDGTTFGAVVHRKGATPAHRGTWGIIPGTCGTNSYLVRGLGNPDTLNSSSHGAGRVHSRSEAKRQHNQKKFEKSMKDVLYHGVAPDEAPVAYKAIEDVIAPQEDSIFKVQATMKPKIVVMGGRSDDGD